MGHCSQQSDTDVNEAAVQAVSSHYNFYYYSLIEFTV